LNLVIFGGAGAPLVSTPINSNFLHLIAFQIQVADELAKANVPVILTHNRGALDSFEKFNSLPGPPLSKSPAAVLAAAGVTFGLALPDQSKFPFLATFFNC